MISFFKRRPEVKESDQILVEDNVLCDVQLYLKENSFIEFKGAKSDSPLEVATDLMGRFVRFSLQTEVSFHLDCIEIFNKAGRNIAPNKKTIISSMYNDEEKYNGEGALKGKKNGGCGFHTKRERNPWLVVDLKTIRKLDKVIVYNREGEFYSRALSLKIEVSKDLKQWSTIFDNWQFIKDYQQGQMSEQIRALLYAGILEAGPAQAFIKKLKKNNQHDDALRFHQQVNELVAEKKVALGPHGFMRTFELRPAGDKQKIYEDLQTLLTLMNNEFGVPSFISSGTLLGIVRDGQLIAHDDDVDICYISNETSEETILAERLCLVEFLTSKGYRLAPSGIAHYWCTTPRGTSLDIFTGFIEGDKCSLNPIGKCGVNVSDVLPLVAHQTNNVTLMLPQNPEPLLILNYGPSWRKPDPLWTFNWGQAKKDFKFLYF